MKNKILLFSLMLLLIGTMCFCNNDNNKVANDYNSQNFSSYNKKDSYKSQKKSKKKNKNNSNKSSEKNNQLNSIPKIELDSIYSTLDRIEKGIKHPHRNDGSVFRNFPPRSKKEPLLPKREKGYYREYVVPTPKVRGPGARRLVIGREGEVYYTKDHYDSFIKVK